MTVEEKIDELLTRGVVTFVDPQGEFRKKLLKKAKGEDVGEIIIKFGVDPTRPDIHLGHAVVLRKLRQFQELGCKIVFLVGDFTARIGDPTGKSKVRPEIEQEEVEVNMRTYLEQIDNILLNNEKAFSWIRNTDWFMGVTDIVVDENKGAKIEIGGKSIPTDSFLSKAWAFSETRMQLTHLGKRGVVGVTLRGLFWTLGKITHAQLIERDMFQNRLNEGNPLYMHEMLYPVLQGIDSYALFSVYGACDLEIGGTDQTFNMLMGREVMKINNQPEQAVMSMDILVGTDGKEKMSKSLDNYIGITDEPQNMFGKTMSIPDTAIVNYYKLCTSKTLNEVTEIEDKLKDPKVNPRDVKLDLAQEIVSMYHGQEQALKARESFLSTFQKKEIPDDVEEIKGEGKLGELLKAKEIVASMNEWRRLVGEGAVKRISEGGGEEKIADDTIEATPGVYKIGKRRFIKIV